MLVDVIKAVKELGHSLFIEMHPPRIWKVAIERYNDVLCRHFFYHVLDLNSDHVISKVGIIFYMRSIHISHPLTH